MGGASCRKDSDCAPGEQCKSFVCTTSTEDRDGSAAQGEAHILASPTVLDFGAPLLGQEVVQTIEVTNAGEGDLHITEVRLLEDDAHPEYSVDGKGKVEITLETGELARIDVTLVNDDTTADTGVVRILSDAANESVTQIELTSELKGTPGLCMCSVDDVSFDPDNPTTCTDVTEIDWTGIPWGTTELRELAIWNCAEGDDPNFPLELVTIEMTATTEWSDRYSVTSYVAGSDGAETTVAPPMGLDPWIAGGSGLLYLRVTLLATDDGGDVPPESLVIVSNEGGDENVERLLPMVGTLSGCPPELDDCNGNPADGCECPLCVPADERCDGVDNDCNGTIDDGDGPCGGICDLDDTLGGICDGDDEDQCEEGIWECSGLNDLECTDGPEASPEQCNDRDDDCDLEIDEGDNGCGGVCALEGAPGELCDVVSLVDRDSCPDDQYVCTDSNLVACVDVDTDVDGDGYSAGGLSCDGDCADSNANVFPGAPEICNGIDDDCDTVVDEGSSACGGACTLSLPLGTSCDFVGDTDLDTCADDILICADLNTTQCSDVDTDLDNDGFGLGDGCVQDCDDANAGRYPLAVELCDGVDNDCDGTVDNGTNGCGGACTLSLVLGAACDAVGDTDPDSCADDIVSCVGLNEADCVDVDNDRDEVCDGVDNDCDGTVDEGTNACGGVCPLDGLPGTACIGAGYLDDCGEGEYVCTGRNTTECDDVGTDADGDGWRVDTADCEGDCDDTIPDAYPGGTEVCDGVDNDCDGTVDEGPNACGASSTICTPVMASWGENSILTNIDTHTGVTTDTYIEETSPTQNFGARDGLRIGADGLSPVGLLRFDLSAIPAGAVVCAAELRLWNWGNDSSDTFGVYRVLEAWDEGTLNGGTGAANWTQRRESELWTQAGCGVPNSCSSTADTTFVPSGGAGTIYSLTLSNGLVQGWMDGANYGLAIKNFTGTDGTWIRSSEHSTNGQRPSLRLTYYEVP